MHSNTHEDLKQLILMSWKNRWSEIEWSKHARTYLQNPSDVFHVAEALVSQAFIGSSPNTLLIDYIWYGINAGLFSYASVITAISKHDDLHKIDSTRELYQFLSKCLSLVNDHPLVEDSMDLCCSLRMILQWLLTNTESFLKGVSHGFITASEELLRLNCQILKQLTTSFRTSILLTIARFEESGIWSHIETDLAVIKTSGGQHPLHSEISESCHCVSQLSRCSINPKPIHYVKSSYPISYPIASLLMLEVHCRKYSEPEGLASQLALLAQVYGLSMSDLAFQILRSCFLGFLDAIEIEKEKESDWYAMIFVQLPKVFLFLKSNPRNFEFSRNLTLTENWFETALCDALNRLKEFDCLIDDLSQLSSDFNWFKVVTEVFLQHELLSNRFDLQGFLQPDINKHYFGVDKCFNPLAFVTMHRNLSVYIATFNLNPTSFDGDWDRMLKNFQTITVFDKFNGFISAAAASGQLMSFADQLFQLNDAMKVRSTESNKTASARAAIFDLSFLLLCYITKLFGKEKVFSTNLSISSENFFARNWIDMWIKSGQFYNPVQYKPVISRVENYIKLLRGTSEMQLIQTDWSDVAMNLPHAVLELLKANQQGYLGASDLTCIFSSIRDHFPLSAILATITVVCRNIRLNQGSKDVLVALIEKSRVQSQVMPLYDDRFVLFEKVAEHLIGDLLPKQSKPGDCVMTRNRAAAFILREAFTESIDLGCINVSRLDKFMFSYRYLGVASFTRQIVNFIRQESRLAALETMFNLIFAVFRIDLSSFTIYLLKHGLENLFMSEPYTLVAPLGSFVAEMMVLCLDNALNDRVLKQKSLLRDKDFISPFLFELSPARKRESLMKVRRMLSCSTEHDLSSGSNSELSPDDPLLIVFCDFVQNLWNLIVSKDSKVIKNFAFTFIRHCLYSSPLLSRAVKEAMPLAMVKAFSDMLIEDSRELLFAACDLGNPEIRRITADAVCRVTVDQ